jgi:hypothetical protein
MKNPPPPGDAAAAVRARGAQKRKADGSARGWGLFPPALEQWPRRGLRQLIVLFECDMVWIKISSAHLRCGGQIRDGRLKPRIPLRHDAFHRLAGDMSIHHLVSKDRRHDALFYSRRFADR